MPSRKQALDKLKKLSDTNTLNIRFEINRMLSDSGYYSATTCTNMMTDKEILKFIKICRKHSINFHLFDGTLQWAHKESMNYH